jgi:hypothetical protein
MEASFAGKREYGDKIRINIGVYGYDEERSDSMN